MSEKTGDGTVGKSLKVLDQVAEFGRPVRFSELLVQSDFPKATLFRFVQTLTNQGMLSYNRDTQTYGLGLRLVRLAHTAWKTSSLAPVAQPFIDALAEEVGETIHLAQMENGQVLFIDKRKTTDRFETLAEAGKVAPAHCTGVGKAILAFMSEDRRQRALRQQNFMQYTARSHTTVEALLVDLEQIRKTGIAYDHEEHETGIISIAAPILKEGGKVVGALSIATSTSRHSFADLDGYRESLLRTTRAIGNEVANWQFPS